MIRPTFLSLFSGVGGLDLGLKRAGWSCVGQVEIDEFCQRVLAKHWPEVPRWGDIKELDPDDLPRADLICAGFPCQPVSSAGKRLAQADERWLWPEVARFVRVLRPRWVLLENVPGLLARGMGDVLGELAACGYDAEWDCIPASAVGAPHRRDRVWVVAYPAGDGRQGQPAAAVRGEHDPLGRGEFPRRDGQDGIVADANGQGQHWGQELPGGRNGLRRAQPLRADVDGCGSRQLAHPNGTVGRQPEIVPEAGSAALLRPAPPGPRRCGSALADPNDRPKIWAPVSRSERHPWPIEPDVGRVAHGVPARVDRLGALGNAVVPQVAELIGRRILEAAA